MGIAPSDGARRVDDESTTSASRPPTLEEEVVVLRRRLQDAPKRVRTLEERLLETKGQLAQAVSPEREADLHPARGTRAHRRRCARRSTSSPSRRRPTARCSARNDDGTVDVFSGGRKMRVAVHPELDGDELRPRRRGRAQRVAQRRAGPRRRASPARS